MNKQAQSYWEKFWGNHSAPTNVVAEAFGWPGTPLADELAALIITGKKTATCSAYTFYEEDEPLPVVGVYTVLLNSKDEPVAIIKTVKVEIIPMNEVSEDFALAEGEGDYQDWYRIHKEFFTEQGEELGIEFSEDMRLVCEWFELIDIKK